MTKVHVSDHAILRYLERAHGVDIEAIRRHLAGRAVTGARLGAAAVVLGKVKLLLRHHDDGVTVVTALERQWPSRETSE